MKKKSTPQSAHSNTSSIVPISEETTDKSINIVLDTLRLGKQIIVFVNSKKSAEATAEKISVLLKKRTRFLIPNY